MKQYLVKYWMPWNVSWSETVHVCLLIMELLLNYFTYWILYSMNVFSIYWMLRWTYDFFFLWSQETVHCKVFRSLETLEVLTFETGLWNGCKKVFIEWLFRLHAECFICNTKSVNSVHLEIDFKFWYHFSLLLQL